MRTVFADCRFDLDDPPAARGRYLAGHLPGAVFLDLDHDLSDKTLEETSQLVVVRELAVFFHDYEQIHGIRSRRSGNVVYLEIFLEFRQDLPFGAVQETMDRIRTRLETHIGNSRVLVVPSRSPPT